MTAVQRARLLCLFAAMAVMALFLVASVHLRDLLGNLAVTRVSNTVGRIVTRAVEDTVQSGEFAYDKLISFQKDSQGRITALTSNMAEFNRLQAAITQDILTRLGETADTNLSIPLGTLTGTPCWRAGDPGSPSAWRRWAAALPTLKTSSIRRGSTRPPTGSC